MTAIVENYTNTNQNVESADALICTSIPGFTEIIFEHENKSL